LLYKYCKEGASVITIFGSPHKKREKKIKKYIKKITAVKRGCQSAQQMVKNWLRRLKITKIEI
jgi:hypothetical protein